MTDGYLVDQSGKIVTRVHGWAGGQAPSGQSFVADPTMGLEVGAQAPTAFAASISSTDAMMSRAAEDLITALVTKGTLAWGDLPSVVKQHVNARRALRGESALS